jgi:hypothetical protein
VVDDEVTWEKIGCQVADAIRCEPGTTVGAARTDLDGLYGDPEVYTEWVDKYERPVLREHRYPNRDGSRPDDKPCEHYRPRRG